jgi:hypothetical protein
MNDEFDDDLTPDQWQALKALRTQAAHFPRANRFTIQSLVALGLLTLDGGLAAITPRGRKVLVRGSPRLLQDLAA